MSVTTNTYTETDLGNISPNPLGEYNAKLAYEYLDLVEFKGGSYLCVIELGKTVTDIAPTEGETTAVWQCIAVPGGLTPEYINIHTEVLAKAKEVETNRQAVSEMKTSLEQLEANVTTKHDETVASAANAKTSEANAKTSETEAKKSEQSALDSKNAMDQTIADFNAGLDTVKGNIVGELNTVKDDAISAINTQANASVENVKTQTADYINKEKLIAQQELHDIVDNFNTTAAGKKDEIVNVATEKIQQMTTLLSDTTDAKNAAQTSEVNAKKSETASKQSETNAKASETNVIKLEKDVATAKDEVLAAKSQIDIDKTAIDKAVTDTQISATKAKESETKAKESETTSAQSAAEALISKSEASASATTATEKAILASTKADEASAFATNAKTSETKSKEAETNVTAMQTQVTKDKEVVTTIKTEVTALQESINASGNKINTDATTAIKNIETKKTEVVDAIEQYGAVQVSTEVPTSPHVDVYINPTNEDNYSIPDVRDNLVNEVDTWSSKKIDSELRGKADAIVETASGESIQVKDSSGLGFEGLRIFGKSTQDGVPTPESPVPIVNVGDKGNIALKIDGDTPPQSLTLATPNGLPGIKVDSDGSYTDENGQQWVCDEIDLERGKYVQRIVNTVLNSGLGELNVGVHDNGTCYLIISPKVRPKRNSLSMCEGHKGKGMWTDENGYVYIPSNRTIVVTDNRFTDLDLAKRIIDAKQAKLLYIMDMPIEHDLTPEEIAAYKALHTNYPTTVISNDESAHMEVTYVADTKNYIAKVNASLQKQITELQNALISQKISGGV